MPAPSSPATDITLLCKLAEALQGLPHAGAAPDREAFFQALCLKLTEVLGVSHALAAMLIPEPGQRVHTLGYCAGGAIGRNFSYALAGTPGHDVSAGELRHYNGDAQIQFPNDLLLREIGATSYFGMPLRAWDGRVIGVMAAFNTGPLDVDGPAQAVFQVLTTLAATELDRLQTQCALRKSDERYALAATGSAGGVWDWDIASGGVYYSSRFKDLLGYATHEFPHTFSAWESIIHPDDLARVREALEKHLMQGIPYRVDYRLRAKSGQYRWFETSGQALWDHKGAPSRMAGSHLDIHERKQAENALAENERMISTLLSNLPGGAAYRARKADAGGWVLDFISLGCLAVTGHPSEAFVGQPLANLRSLIHPGDAEQVATEVAQAMDLRTPFEVTYRINAGDGQEKWIWERGQGISGRDGSVQFLEAFISDVTEKRRLEYQILRAQRMESIGTLAGGIAHDLNNVLTPIVMTVSLLRNKLSDPRDLDLLATLEASANRGAGMVRQIISFARGLDGKMEELRPADVVMEIEQLISEIFPKSITRHIHCDPDVACIQGDHTQLHQVLLNVCLNARDAMLDGGTLIVRVAGINVDAATASANADARPGPYVMFEVTDTGTGIPAKIRHRIFDPFFTTKEIGKGTGLGLATTLGIVRAHRGFIDLSSEAAKGTAFRICIPAASATAPAVARPAVAAAPPLGKGELVMLVDDDISVLTATTHTLEAFGYRVVSAGNGAEAVTKFEQCTEKPSIVFTDLMMPVMDGPTLIKRLKAIQPGLLIVAASGLNNHLAAEARSLGVTGFLLKPYHFGDLLRLLHEQLRCVPST